MPVNPCPRCGRPVQWAGRGRRPRWCSQACRRASYEERRAAASGAIAVRVVNRATHTEHVRTRLREPTTKECVQRVLASPRACREVLNGLTTMATTGHLDSGAHTATLTALRRLVQASPPPSPAPPADCQPHLRKLPTRHEGLLAARPPTPYGVHELRRGGQLCPSCDFTSECRGPAGCRRAPGRGRGTEFSNESSPFGQNPQPDRHGRTQRHEATRAGHDWHSGPLVEFRTDVSNCPRKTPMQEVCAIILAVFMRGQIMACHYLVRAWTNGVGMSAEVISGSCWWFRFGVMRGAPVPPFVSGASPVMARGGDEGRRPRQAHRVPCLR